MAAWEGGGQGIGGLKRALGLYSEPPWMVCFPWRSPPVPPAPCSARGRMLDFVRVEMNLRSLVKEPHFRARTLAPSY